MAFKKSMEQQHGDEIDELFNFSGQEELDFDPDELEHLEMLEVKKEEMSAHVLWRCIIPRVEPEASRLICFES